MAERYLDKSHDLEDKSLDSEDKKIEFRRFLRIRAAIRRKHPKIVAHYQDRLRNERYNSLEPSEADTEQPTSSNSGDVPAVADEVATSGPAHECRCRSRAHPGFSAP